MRVADDTGHAAAEVTLAGELELFVRAQAGRARCG